MHGAISATIVDWAGGLAIASTGREKTGVSTDIHISYAGGAKEGEWIIIEAWAPKVGNTLAFTKVEIRKQEDGGLIAMGNHTKYVKL